MTISRRQQVEQTILGTVLLYNCYTTASFIVNEKNFSIWGKFDYSKIWLAFKAMHPATVIDLITVMTRLPPAYVTEVCRMTNRVASGQHLQMHCLILFELDLRGKFVELIRGCQATIEISEMPSGTAANLIEAMDQVAVSAQDYEQKILTTIPDGISYIQQLHAPDEVVEALQQFDAAIDKRVAGWRRQIELQGIFIALEKLTHDCTGNKKLSLNLLANITTRVSLKSEIDDTILFELDKIQKLILDQH